MLDQLHAWLRKKVRRCYHMMSVPQTTWENSPGFPPLFCTLQAIKNCLGMSLCCMWPSDWSKPCTMITCAVDTPRWQPMGAQLLVFAWCISTLVAIACFGAGWATSGPSSCKCMPISNPWTTGIPPPWDQHGVTGTHSPVSSSHGFTSRMMFDLAITPGSKPRNTVNYTRTHSGWIPN